MISTNKTLTQFNTLGSLMAGLYGGTYQLSDLLEVGDFGFGTFDGVDGEMIVLDRTIYQATVDGPVTIKTDLTKKTPYAAVVHFKADKKKEISGNYEALQDQIVSQLKSENLFHAIKVSGTFDRVQLRMATKSETGLPFDQVKQPQFVRENIAGTIVGFWTPAMFQGVAVAGFHLHFLSEDKTFGGHISDLVGENLTLEMMAIDELHQKFPVENEVFLNADFSIKQINDAIKEVE